MNGLSTVGLPASAVRAIRCNLIYSFLINKDFHFYPAATLQSTSVRQQEISF